MQNYVAHLPDVFVSVAVEKAFLTGVVVCISAFAFVWSVAVICDVIRLINKRKGNADGTN